MSGPGRKLVAAATTVGVHKRDEQWLRLWVEHPDARIAPKLNTRDNPCPPRSEAVASGNPAACEHGFNPCWARCGVAHRGSWKPIPYEVRLDWLRHEISRIKDDDTSIEDWQGHHDDCEWHADVFRPDETEDETVNRPGPGERCGCVQTAKEDRRAP